MSDRTYWQVAYSTLKANGLLFVVGLVNGGFWWVPVMIGLTIHGTAGARLVYWKRELVKAKERQAFLHHEEMIRLYGIDPADFLLRDD